MEDVFASDEVLVVADGVEDVASVEVERTQQGLVDVFQSALTKEYLLYYDTI